MSCVMGFIKNKEQIPFIPNTFYATLRSLSTKFNETRETTQKRQPFLYASLSLPSCQSSQNKNLRKYPFPPSSLPPPLLICSLHLSLEHKTFPLFAKIIGCNQSKTNYFTTTPCTHFTNSQIHKISRNMTGKG